jgi:hypothetical protein
MKMIAETRYEDSGLIHMIVIKKNEREARPHLDQKEFPSK